MAYTCSFYESFPFSILLKLLSGVVGGGYSHSWAVTFMTIDFEKVKRNLRKKSFRIIREKRLRKKVVVGGGYIDSLAVTFMTIDLSAHIPQPSRCPTAQSNVEN